MDLSLVEYQALAELRYQIRRYVHFSEEQARQHGLEPQQHQLLLAIKGLPEGARATIGELAVRLQLKHHSTVELVDRLAQHGYVFRSAGQDDRREVLVRLSGPGGRILRSLSLAHQQELKTAGPALGTALRALRKARRTRSKHSGAGHAA
ncbi:MAG: MarR family transcriptional regulator [Acidobacteriia bacterium]|nr:MarR family transcriptional regulator [Terriglobia bacterium]